MTNLKALRELIINKTGESDCQARMYLCDVLYCLNNPRISVNSCGVFQWISVLPFHKILEWDLTKDLDNQSPETIQQLLKLMENN